MGRNREIDWLRGYAVVLVILEHAGLIMHGPWFWDHLVHRWFWGSSGVDLFFVISGFVISQTFIDQYDNARGQGEEGKVAALEAVMRFYVRRVVRLYPAAITWAVIIMLGTIFLNQSHIWLGLNLTFRKLIAGLLYLYNFSEAQGPTMLGYYWSLSVEMQFYLFFPLFLALVKEPRSRMGLLALLFFLRIFYQPGEGARWLFRFDGILIGILIFYFCRSWMYAAVTPFFLRRPGPRLAVTAALLILLATTPLAIEKYPDFATAVVCLIAGVWVWLATYSQGFIAAFGVPRLWDWIGTRSYSLYLCHLPMMLINRAVLFLVFREQGIHLNNHDHWPVLLLGWVLSTVAATEITYRTIERPFQKKGRELARRINLDAVGQSVAP
jgi:peptidoglycan/LPS O-acetylase OafA/YrhL